MNYIEEYEKLIAQLDEMIRFKNIDRSIMVKSNNIQNFEYAALINEISMLTKVRNDFLLYK